MTTKLKSLINSKKQLQQAEQIPWSTFRGVLFDWAGTTIDFGSLAPVAVVRAVFQEFGIEVTEAEARQPMGKAKIDHLREVLMMPRIASLWNELHPTAADETAIRKIYIRFLELQKAVLSQHCDVIPGVLEFVTYLRAQGIKIGSSTGYTRELMDVVCPIVAASGYQPDATVCSDEVTAGRPAPWSNFQAAERIGVYPMNQILVVDDSIAGIQAGRNAGCISVAVTTTGNPFGKTMSQLQQMSDSDIANRHHQAECEFYSVGADLVVESVAVLHELWKQFS